MTEGRNQASPWESLKNQIFLGSDDFVERARQEVVAEKDLSEVPMAQMRKIPQPLNYYAENGGCRDQAITMAYAGGGMLESFVDNTLKLLKMPIEACRWMFCFRIRCNSE